MTVYNAINNHDHNVSAEVSLSGPAMPWLKTERKKVYNLLINEQIERNEIT